MLPPICSLACSFPVYLTRACFVCAVQMLLAVHTIHEERIVHSDLKPANFLIVEGQLKVSPANRRNNRVAPLKPMKCMPWQHICMDHSVAS